MEEDQRTTILQEMAAAMAERGASAHTVTLADVAARVGISTASIEELIGDREACMLEAFELGVERAGAAMSAAYGGESRWLDAVRAAMANFLWFLDAEPALARLMVVHSTGAGPRVLRRRMEVLGTLATAVDRGREEGADGPPAVMAEGVVGAVLAVVHNRLLAEEPQVPMELFGSLISIVVLPYLGAGVARRELSRPAPRLRGASEMDLSVSLAEAHAGVRLTYRTARVLVAIDDYPGASNREVAERAGIVDQG